MPFYHGTYEDRLGSILKHGLGGIHSVRNFPDAEKGVYLSLEPALCLAVLLQHSVETSHPSDRPKDRLDAMRVIVIDDTRIDRDKLRLDPEFVNCGAAAFIYDGIIDIAGMPVLDAATLCDEFAQKAKF